MRHLRLTGSGERAGRRVGRQACRWGGGWVDWMGKQVVVVVAVNSCQ